MCISACVRACMHACLCVEDEIQSSEFDKHNITHKDSLADQLCQGTYLQLACWHGSHPNPQDQLPPLPLYQLPVTVHLSTGSFLPVDEVAQVVQQLRIVFNHHVCPGEGTVLALRPNVEQIEAPDVGRDPCILGHVSKHSYPPALREFPILIIQVLWTKKKDSNHTLPSLTATSPFSQC